MDMFLVTVANGTVLQTTSTSAYYSIILVTCDLQYQQIVNAMLLYSVSEIIIMVVETQPAA